MRRFASKLLDPTLRPPAPTTLGKNASGGNDRDTHESAVSGPSEETISKKPSARQRLDALSGFRLRSSAIKFSSTGSHSIGGKAKVIQATYKQGYWSDGQVVAVKKLHYSQNTNKIKFGNEFIHEVEVMAGLSHENLVQLVGFVEDLKKGEAWIVLSWHPNGNISEFVATRDWEIPERVSLIRDTFEGIKYLHTRQPPICHGDLKSLNILVSSSYRGIITDFGSARAIIESEDDAAGKEHAQQIQENSTKEEACPQIQVGAIGTQLTLTGPAWSLRWAPPEVVSGKPPNLSSDVWAAGWICWEVMTGKVPFPELNSEGAITLTVIRGKVPSPREDTHLAQVVALCSLMTDCWKFDPGARTNISRCCDELRWMPSIPPSGGSPSGSKAPSFKLLLEMGQMQFKRDSYEAAISLYQQALSLAESSGNQILAADALTHLGNAYRMQSKNRQAEESFIRAYEIYGRVGDDEDRATTLTGLGHVYHGQAKFTEAEESYTRAQEAFARIGNDQGQANTLYGLGVVRRHQGKYTEAEESLIQAQGIYARSGDDLGLGNTFDGLGTVYRIQSRYTPAEESFTRALEAFARIGNDQGQANTLHGLGDVYGVQLKYTQAEEAYTQALEVHARIGYAQGEANALIGLGRIYRLQRKHTQAEESYTRAQEIYIRVGDVLGQANAIFNMGHVRENQQRNADAAAHYVEARDLYAQLGLTKRVEDATICLESVLPDRKSSGSSA
ncbi:hypothetical protein M407DRAFT_21056 [Tulasnella calospora MUT 4182]|uniref:Protein kinase domain-containing protein n=1 Tax=Tulasnella calospora MUT 4182 TaxID=1051891 RepID=A0A0C3QNT7_9AGAM|nr:hypothetical protein M407DRAFT_21056 [Tulasnella calospora MUT 4182]